MRICLDQHSLHSHSSKMYKQVVFVLFSLALVSAYELVQDEEGQEYYLVPLHRARREAKLNLKLEEPEPRHQPVIDVKKGDSGTSVFLGDKVKIYDDGTHRVDGGAFVAKHFDPSGPGTLGGKVGYNHIPSESSLNLGASHTERFGTNVDVSGKANLWRDGNARLDAVGSYQRRYGGAFGTGSPNYYGGVQFRYDF